MPERCIKNDFAFLDDLGARLEAGADEMECNMEHACLCYICSGNVENFIKCWDALNKNSDATQSSPDKVQVINAVLRCQSSFYFCFVLVFDVTLIEVESILI